MPPQLAVLVRAQERALAGMDEMRGIEAEEKRCNNGARLEKKGKVGP